MNWENYESGNKVKNESYIKERYIKSVFECDPANKD